MNWTFYQLCAVCTTLFFEVIATPPPGYVKPPDTDKHPPKYEFGYDVKDGRGGGQGHLETREGEYALGKYYVNLPSNEQKVDYFADDWGFHPLVEYRTSSGSSSMSTQFALGEKAVAALSKQYGVAPPLEILKTKVANSLVAGAGPQVSIPAASGIIPGPSAEPVPNSLLDSENYSPSSTPAPSTTPGSVYSSTPTHDSTATINLQHISVSTEAPSFSTSTENYSSVTASGSYNSAVDAQSQTVYQNELSGSAGYSTTENYGSAAGNEELIEGRYKLNGGNSYYQSSSSGRGYSSSSGSEGLSHQRFVLNGDNSYYQSGSSSASSDSDSNQEISYSQSPRPYSSGAESHSQSSSSLVTQNNHQITAYLADSNAAVDVTSSKGTPNGLPGLPGITDYSPNTRISAVLVAEKDQYNENEVRSQYNSYVSSTTPKPRKTILKPIIVTENRGDASNLALFSSHGTSADGYHSNQIGKLYHRDGHVKDTGSYSGLSVTENSSVGSVNVDEQIYSTPAPTSDPVLVTPRTQFSRLTSSGNILAPIQAALSISAHNEEDCNHIQSSGYGEEKENTPVSGPDVEKQEVREEAVYKTTVDIQKSIPFEIHPSDNEQQSQDYKLNSEEHHGSAEVQDNLEGSIQEAYQQNINSGYRENVQESHEAQGNYGQNVNSGYRENIEESHEAQGNYGQQVNELNTHSQINDVGANLASNTGYEQNYGTPQQYQQEYQIPDARPPHEQNANQYSNNNFIQQVLFAYHKMANSRPYLPENEAYPTGVPVTNQQPLFVPNKLYYVYMQRYNPYVNRYGMLYTNYKPSSPSQPADVPAGNEYYQPNKAYSELEQGRQPAGDAYQNIGAPNSLGIINVAYENANNVQANSANQYNTDSSAFTSQVSSANIHGQVNYEQNEAVNVHQAERARYESQQAAQEYAAQLNALSNSVRGAVENANAALGTQNGQYYEQSAENQAASYAQQTVSVLGGSGEGKYVDAHNDVHQNNIQVPQYLERTKLVEVEKPIHIAHPVPVEYTKIVQTQVPIPVPVPVPQTQYVEKHIPVPQAVPVEVTRVIEKPVPVPHPVPVEYTKVVAVEKPVAIPHPVPYPVTKLVAVDRPVAYPHPVPVPYAVPHPIGVPVPQYIPYPNVVPVPVKDYRLNAGYFYRKPTGGRLFHRDSHGQPGKNLAFRPSQPMYTSQYPPQTYTVMGYFKNPYSRSRGQARKLCIEYGGFKPPMVPSVQIDEEPKPTSAEDKKD